MDRSDRGTRRSRHWYLGSLHGLELESVAKFLVGGIAGWLWERRFSPELKGVMPGIPFRPIYGFGAAFAQNSLDKNTLLSMYAEKLGNSKTKLWAYDTEEFFAIDEDVRADYAVVFGEAMTSFNRTWDRVFHPK